MLIYLSVKKFGSQMRTHILWGLIWIQLVCKPTVNMQSSNFTALQAGTDNILSGRVAKG